MFVQVKFFIIPTRNVISPFNLQIKLNLRLRDIFSLLSNVYIFFISSFLSCLDYSHSRFLDLVTKFFIIFLIIVISLSLGLERIHAL